MNNSAPEVAVNSVLKPSDKMADDSPIVKGYDFNNGLDYDALIASYKLCGFQATNFGKAVDEINNMVSYGTRGVGGVTIAIIIPWEVGCDLCIGRN